MTGSTNRIEEREVIKRANRRRESTDGCATRTAINGDDQRWIKSGQRGSSSFARRALKETNLRGLARITGLTRSFVRLYGTVCRRIDDAVKLPPTNNLLVRSRSMPVRRVDRDSFRLGARSSSRADERPVGLYVCPGEFHVNRLSRRPYIQ